jgi:clathrin heavy chain
MKTMMKKTQVANPVLFWKWLDLKTIAIVTDKEVLHWSMDGTRPLASSRFFFRSVCFG